MMKYNNLLLFLIITILSLNLKCATYTEREFIIENPKMAVITDIASNNIQANQQLNWNLGIEAIPVQGIPSANTSLSNNGVLDAHKVTIKMATDGVLIIQSLASRNIGVDIAELLVNSVKTVDHPFGNLTVKENGTATFEHVENQIGEIPLENKKGLFW